MMRLVVTLLACTFSVAVARPALCFERLIAVDVRNARGALDPMPRACVGAGRVAEGLRADWQRQLTYIKQECGFTYLRMHGLLGDDMGVYREDKNGRPEYNWQYIDEVYDFLQRIHIKPFVELGFSPARSPAATRPSFGGRATSPNPRIRKSGRI